MHLEGGAVGGSIAADHAYASQQLRCSQHPSCSCCAGIVVSTPAMPTPCLERILLSDTTKSHMELAESTWHFGVTNSTTCVTVLQVEKSPVVIKTGVSKGDAEAMKKQLEAGGQDRVVLLCGWRWGFFVGQGLGQGAVVRLFAS